MEVIRKRRASTEVEALMTAVKTDYEYFANFNTIFESPLAAPKRKRSLSDASLRKYSSRIDDSIAPTKTKHGDRISWNLCQALSLAESMDRNQTTEANQNSRQPSPQSPRFTPPSQKFTPPSQKFTPPSPLPLGDSSNPPSRWTKISTPGTTFQRYHSWPPFKTPGHIPPPPCSSSVSSSSPTSTQQDMVSSQDNTAHLEYIFQKTTPQSRECFVEIPSGVSSFGVPRRQNFDLKDGIQEVLTGQPSDDDNSIKMTTRIFYDEPPPSGTLINNTPSKVSSVRQSVRLTTKEKITKRLMNRRQHGPMKKPSFEEFKSPAKEITATVDQTHNPFLKRQSSEAWVRSKLSINQGSAFVDVNHVDNPCTNEKEESSKKRQEELTISNCQVLPNYVITRVGSLLWLGKDIVYPVTLEEIQRRVKDPENFSFQMLIAYVRHSRAKGRQFLDYWKCQPTGKSAKPNVLSKLCEADTKSLVDGIQKVNEEYFPGEKLARNAAQRFEDLWKTGNGVGHVSQEQRILEKVDSIEKSR